MTVIQTQNRPFALDKYLNKITCGDSYELIKEIPDKSIDAIYTDIPYLYQNGGGGTTCVAAKETGRQFIGIEIDPKWAKVASDRLNNIDAHGQISMFLR